MLAGGRVCAVGVFLGALASVVSGVNAARGQCTEVSPVPSPPNPQIVAAIYDPVRGQTVSFDYAGQTWGWDGTAYTLLATTGPSLRHDTSMAFDSARGVIVLFGGVPNGSSTPLADTWEWDGAAWTQRAVSGPGARSRAAMTFDSARGVTVLFGGSGAQSTSSETWEYNGAAWARRSNGFPQANSGSVFIYDAVRQVSVLVGGDFPTSAVSKWNGVEWTESDFPAPLTFKKAGAAFDSVSGRVVLVPGQSTSSPGTWAYDGAAWTQLDTFDRRSTDNFSKVAFDSARSREVLFGPQPKVWERPSTGWTQVYGDQFMPFGPPDLVGPAPVFDSDRSVVVARSGNNTWEYDGASWRSIAPYPINYSMCATAYDPVHHRTVALQLLPNNQYQTWTWDGVAWTNLAIPVPPAPAPTRFPWRLGVDASRGTLVASLYNTNNEVRLWELDGTTWRDLEGSHSGPTARAADWVFDARRGVWVFFGGTSSELWEWNGTSWTQRAAPGGPAGTVRNAAWYDPVAGVVVIGVYPTVSFWAWDGVEWTQLEPMPPPGQLFDHYTVYYPPADSLMSQQGYWLHHSRPVIDAHPADTQLPPGARLELTVGASTPSPPLAFRWRRDGVELTDGGAVSGAATATLVIDPAGPADAGLYEAVVNDECGVSVSRRASVTVGCGPSDWNFDGIVNSTDVSDFINDWFADQSAGTLVTDFNHDGVSNSTDVSDFINAWFDAPASCR